VPDRHRDIAPNVVTLLPIALLKYLWRIEVSSTAPWLCPPG